MIESTAGQRWFLCKHEDGSIFGALPFAQMRRWAATAQVAPHDTLSQDQQTWLKAPMFPELEMDWLVEVANESYYGPTTLGAVTEFLRLGEIDEETFVINSCDGSRHQVKELGERLELFPPPDSEPMDEPEGAPLATTMALDVPTRIRDLEQSLFEERRALHDCEMRCRARGAFARGLRRSPER
jgi:hypothetical protein